MELIHQPFGPLRLGSFLSEHLASEQWTEFRGAVAFAKRSGTQHLTGALEAFDQRAAIRLSLGIDFYGTSQEALTDLLHAISHGQVWVYHNSGPSTFHPKVYLFKKAAAAELVVGSGNLTQGGLFTNYEASLAIKLDLNKQDDTALLASVEHVLDGWSHDIPGRCLRLNEALIGTLVAVGLVRTEAQIAITAAQNMPPENAPVAGPAHQLHAHGAGAGNVPSPFTHSGVPAAPALPVHAAPVAAAADEMAEAVESAGPPAPPAPQLPTAGLPTMALGGHTSFVMTLQNTDVGVGQTTAGTARRSPEVFIPIAALDYNPQFWKFPQQFVADNGWNAAHPQARRHGLGKMDRMNVPMRIGVPQHVSMMFNPDKRDLRLRNEVLRSSGNIGDILLITALNPASGQEYDVQVAAQGTPLFQQLQPLCNIPVGHNSMKSFGYF